VRLRVVMCQDIATGAQNEQWRARHSLSHSIVSDSIDVSTDPGELCNVNALDVVPAVGGLELYRCVTQCESLINRPQNIYHCTSGTKLYDLNRIICTSISPKIH
jgi:hypothetical protein